MPELDKVLAEFAALLKLPDEVQALKAETESLKASGAELSKRVAALEKPTPPPIPPVPPTPSADPAFRLKGGWRLPSQFGGYVRGDFDLIDHPDGTQTILVGSYQSGYMAGRIREPMGTDAGKPTDWPLVERFATRDSPASTYDAVRAAHPDLHYKPEPLGVFRDAPRSRTLVSGLSGYAVPVPEGPFLVPVGDDGVVGEPFGLEGATCQEFGGGVCELPQWFVNRHLGGRRSLGLGRGGYHSGQRSTAGPSLTAVDPETLRLKTPHTPLIQFGDLGTKDKARRERRPADYSGLEWGIEPDDDVGYWAADRVDTGPVVFDLPGFSGVAYWVVRGCGKLQYGNQGEVFADPEAIGAQKQGWYFYSFEQLGRVAGGELKPHEVRGRFREWPLPLPGAHLPWPVKIGREHRVVGARVRGNLLYLLWRWVWGGNSEWWPVVAVYEVV